jgi:hypothetical protein
MQYECLQGSDPACFKRDAGWDVGGTRNELVLPKVKFAASKHD